MSPVAPKSGFLITKLSQYMALIGRAGFDFKFVPTRVAGSLFVQTGPPKSLPIRQRKPNRDQQRYMIIDISDKTLLSYVLAQDTIEKLKHVISRVEQIALICSTVQTVSRTHEDGEDAVAVVLEGSKVFRVRLNRSRSGNEAAFLANGGRLPAGWKDIVLETGMAVYAPKSATHAVRSLGASILLSMTLGADRSLPPIHHALPTTPHLSPASPTVAVKRSRVPYSIPAPDPSNVSRMSDSEDNSSAEHEPGVSFADRQATAPMSVLAQITSKWVLDGVPFVTLLRSTTSSVTAANKIVKLMFNRDMTLRSTFTSDYAWGKLFGQTLPIGDDDMNITSGRMITDTADLADVSPPLGEAIAALIDIARESVYQLCSTQTSSPITVRATSSSVLTRPVGRLPAQRIHVDGTSAHAGRGHEVSCLIALVQQRTVAFIETPLRLRHHPDGRIKNFNYVVPSLEAGSITIFDHTISPHLGHHVSGVQNGHLIAASLFCTFSVTTSEDTPLNAHHGRVDPSPDEYVLKHSYFPAVMICAACEHPVFNRDIKELRLCLQCEFHSPTPKRPCLWVICCLCVSASAPATNLAGLDEALSRTTPRDRVLEYFIRSVTCNCGNGDRHCINCSHDASTWTPFPARCEVLLYFTWVEFEMTAAWLLSLLLTNSLFETVMEPRLRSAPNGQRFSNFIGYVSGSCSRSYTLVDVMLEYAGIRMLTGHSMNGLGLFASAINDTSHINCVQSWILKICSMLEEPGVHLGELNDVFVRRVRQVGMRSLRCSCEENRTTFSTCATPVTCVTIDTEPNEHMINYLGGLADVKEMIYRSFPTVVQVLSRVGVEEK